MKEWVLSVCGIVLLTSVLYVILPTGKTSKIIKSVFAIMCLTVLIKPVFYLKNEDFTLNELFTVSGIDYQNDYLNFVLKQKEGSLVDGVKKILDNSEIHYENIELELQYNEDLALSTKKAVIHVGKNAINDNGVNTIIIDSVFDYLSSYVLTDKSLIKIYE